MEKSYTSEDLSYIAFIAQEQLYEYYKPWYKEQAVDYALNLFKKRVGSIKYASNYDIFKSTESMQLKIKANNLDSEKFWLLLLFLYDYTESCFGKYFIYDDASIADTLYSMINILKSKDCKLTISNQKESIQIDAMPMRKELKSLLIRLHHKGHLNYHPCIGIKENNVEWHKIKFFMGMLDFFLLHYQSDKLQNKRKRKDWLLYSQSLYLIGYLEDEKYLKGYILKKQEIVNLDGANSVKTHIMPLTGLGKFLTDNTKNINDTAIRSKSIYSF